MAGRPRKNSDTAIKIPEADGSNSATTLLSSLDTIVSLLEEKADVQDRIKDEFASIKSMGFDVKIVRKVLARNLRGKDEVATEDALISTYETALESAKLKRI